MLTVDPVTGTVCYKITIQGFQLKHPDKQKIIINIDTGKVDMPDGISKVLVVLEVK